MTDSNKHTNFIGLTLDYLQDMLSAKQRNALEREVMRHPFDEEAFEGLNSLSAHSFQTDLEEIQQKIWLARPKKTWTLTRIAASISILLMVGALSYFAFFNPKKHILPKIPTQHL
ncbi:MAG: hypothetical protein HC896_16715 [Bacteroidales bacterium]|nr:hypothetical protein [Bacteroidales bacterium]